MHIIAHKYSISTSVPASYNIHHDFVYMCIFLVVTHICFSKLTIIGSDNGLSPGRVQDII